MDNSLSSILSEEAPAEEEAIQPVETQQEATDTGEAKGEEQTTPPVAEQKDDHLEKARKGLEAAAKAERERRQAAEARAEAAERKARELEMQYRQPKPTPQPQTEDAKPLRSQFQTEDEWLDARDAWRDRERERETIRARQEQAERERVTRTESALAEAQKIEGFDLQAFMRVPVSEPMADAILDSDAPGKLVHYLQQNPDEATRIAQMPSTARQIAALARIEDKLSAEPDAPTPEKKAPPELPQTLTQARNAKGQFEPAYSGPTPLNAILATK